WANAGRKTGLSCGDSSPPRKNRAVAVLPFDSGISITAEAEIGNMPLGLLPFKGTTATPSRIAGTVLGRMFLRSTVSTRKLTKNAASDQKSVCFSSLKGWLWH